MSSRSGSDSKNTLYCSFCGKSQHEVRKLIAGPTVFICDECVELCMDIIREETKATGLKSTDGVQTCALPILVSSRIMSMHNSTHSSQIKTVGPAISFLTSCWLFPQKLQ